MKNGIFLRVQRCKICVCVMPSYFAVLSSSWTVPNVHLGFIFSNYHFCSVKVRALLTNQLISADLWIHFLLWQSKNDSFMLL